MTLELEATTDILKRTCAAKRIADRGGLAAETENVLENGRQKLMERNLDAIW